MPIVGEEWRDVVGYEGMYLVSNKGRVRSVRRKIWNSRCWCYQNGQIMSPSLTGGHPGLALCRDRKSKRVSVSWLVLEAFVGPRPKDYEACHFPDKDPTNNCIENLRWDTVKNNHQDKKFHGTWGKNGDTRGSKNGSAFLDEAKVLEIRRKYEDRDSNQTQLAAEYGVTQAMISSIVLRKNWKHI